MTADSESSIDIEQLHARVTQLEGTGREAHVQLREAIAEQEADIEAQQEEIREV